MCNVNLPSNSQCHVEVILAGSKLIKCWLGKPSDLVVSIKVWFLPYFDWVGGLFSDKNHTFLKYSNSSRNAKKFFFNYVHPPSWQASKISNYFLCTLITVIYPRFMLLGFMRFINVQLNINVSWFILILNISVYS